MPIAERLRRRASSTCRSARRWTRRRPSVVAAFSTSGAERGYPPSIGTAELRERRRPVDRAPLRRRRPDVGRSAPASARKEFVGTLPQWLQLRSPDRDTVLYPATSYPTYEMGAILAGCRPVAVPMTPPAGSTSTRSTPADADAGAGAVGQQPGQPDRRARRPRRRRRVGAARTACRCSPTSATSSSRGTGRRAAILEHGLDGVVAVHSLSKRSNLAGGRVGFYAGDAELVRYLQEVRKHVGMMVPGPAQAAGVVALDDDDHVAVQRERYRRRLERMAEILGAWTGRADRAAGRRLLPVVPGRRRLGVRRAAGRARAARSSAPASSTAPGATDHVRVAVVQPDERIELVAARLGV